MKKLVLFFLILFQSLFVISCSSESYVDLNALKNDLGLSHFPQGKNFPDSDALILKESHDVHVIIDENYDLETVENVSKVTKLFKNIEAYASVEIPIYAGEKITKLIARTINPDGTIIELKDNDFHTISGSDDGEVFYSDEKRIKFTFPAIQKNSIIEYNYSILEEYPFVMDIWNIQGSIPKLENEYKLTAPTLLLAPKEKGGAGWSWRYCTYNTILDNPKSYSNLNPSNNTRDASFTFIWSKKNIPAFEPEPMMPPYSNYLKYVKFAPSNWKNWNNLSNWYYNKLFLPKFIVTDDIKNEALSLTKNCLTQKDKIKALYYYVQTIRYIAIELGIGGIIPNTPEIIFKRKYGDCKDKSILLLSLLKSLNIKANPVLVLTSDEGKIDPSFPSWNFNHMIVKATVNKKEYWMDPTVEHCRLGALPYQCQSDNVLVLNSDGTSEIERTPASTSTDNEKLITEKINVKNANNATFDISIVYKGEFNLSYRSFFTDKSNDEMVKYCKSLVAQDYLNTKVISYSIENLDSINSDITLHFKITVPNVISRQGSLAFLNVDPSLFSNNFDWLARDKRKYDIEFSFPYTIQKDISVNLPKDNFKIKELPSDFTDNEDGISYNRSCRSTDSDNFKIAESFEINSKDITYKDYSDIKNMFDNVKEELNKKIILSAN